MADCAVYAESIHVNPNRSRISTPPGKLTLGVSSGALLDESHRLVKCTASLQVIDDLLVADRLTRREGIGGPVVYKTLDFFEQALFRCV